MTNWFCVQRMYIKPVFCLPENSDGTSRQKNGHKWYAKYISENSVAGDWLMIQKCEALRSHLQPSDLLPDVRSAVRSRHAGSNSLIFIQRKKQRARQRKKKESLPKMKALLKKRENTISCCLLSRYASSQPLRSAGRGTADVLRR